MEALQPVRFTPTTQTQANLLRELHRLQFHRQQCQEAKDKYARLEDRLNGLTEEPRWSVNVPFGPLAFMPGQLVHTNTINVRLGEDWIVEYSASQAAGVAKRRRIDIDSQIEKLEEALKSIDPVVGKEMGLPDGWSVNSLNEIINNEGLPVCDIQELESDNKGSAPSPTPVARSSLVNKPNTARSSRSGLAKYSQLLDTLEAEDEEEAEHNSEAIEETDNIDTGPSKYESGSDSSEDDEDRSEGRGADLAKEVRDNLPELDKQPDRTPKSSLKTPSAKSQNSSRPTPEKSVSFDLQEAEDEEASDQEGKSDKKEVESFNTFHRPVKELVTERIVENTPAARPVAPSLPSKYSVRTDDFEITTPKQIQTIQQQQQDEEESADLSPEEGDSTDEDDDYYPSDEEEEDQPHIDDLMLSRQLALEYHQKRHQLIGKDKNMLASSQEMVGSDATVLEDGSSSTMRQSRFRSGPLDVASLVVPSLLQQQDLKPGDIIQDVPLAGYTFTQEDHKTIDQRLQMLSMGSNDIYESAPPAQSKDMAAPEAKKEPVAAIREVQERSSAPLVDRPVVPESKGFATASARTEAPKKVSRFKAARAAQ